MKILVVDDDALILRSLSSHLAEEGHTVITAKDGAEANDRMENERERPDLVICDLLMPNISGLTFMTILRNFHNYSIPVIVISSLQKGDLLAAQAGFNEIDFIAKPFSFQELTEKVNKHQKLTQP
jgi:DNA-binding response OmpR family regulator